MPPLGRPTIIGEVSERVIEFVRAGNYVETAAAAAGISKDTFYAWLRRGARERRRLKKANTRPNKTEQPYLAFSDAIQKATGEAEARDVMLIAKAATTQWQAAAWRLERKFPQRWARTERHHISGPDGKPVQSDSKVSLGLTPQTAETIRAELLGIGKDDDE